MEASGTHARERSPEKRIGPGTLGIRSDVAAKILAKFGALAAPRGHTPSLDGWRGLCIAMVLLGHFVPYFLGHLAPLGVEMFLVLSGKLMADLLIARRQPLPTFILRRASRIVPLLALYAGVVAIGLAAAALIVGAPVNWLSPLASLLFFSNYLSEPAPLLEHTWSLAVEEHSYLLLALVAWVSARRPGAAGGIAAVLAGCMVLNGVILFYDQVEGPYVFWRSDVRGASVLISFALCLLLREWQPSWLGRGLPWLSPICLLGALACMIPADPMSPLQVTACTAFAALSVNTIQFSAARFQRILSLGFLTSLGTFSFSLYMWQQPFFMASKGGFPVIVALPLVFICAIWSYLRVEAPARRYLNARWGHLSRRDSGTSNPSTSVL